MRKLATLLIAAIALLFAGLHAWNADATVAGPGALGTTRHAPLVQNVGCRRNAPAVGNHGCARGTHWVCVKKQCWCADCGNNGD